MRQLRARYALAAALLVSTACSGRDDAAVPDAQARSTNAPAANGAGGSVSTSGGPRGPGGQGRTAPTITLAATDIAAVRRDAIEEGIAITGDLNPIEVVEVRARLEGDLVGVYVREGERVRAGQVLARFEASEQESGRTSAEADRVAAQSDLATAQWNLEQTTELYKAGAVAERDYKMAQQAVTASRARLAAAQARLRATSSNLSDTRVLAPTSGVISVKAVENGEHVARGASLFTLVRSDVLELAAAVPARQANVVRVGQTVHFTADARAFDGKVARMSPTVNPTTRSVAVYVQIPNASGALKGGTFASGRVVSRVVSGALVVPAAAVRQSPEEGKPYVYRIAGKTIDIATVQLGVVDDRAGMAEVLDGLSEGDRVVVGNVGALGRGMQVIIAGEESMAKRGGARTQ
ncbi:MAG TPA: efflux RND transporter periplasmic adaptor subunit [Gemmatimonadaceae bacterium]